MRLFFWWFSIIVIKVGKLVQLDFFPSLGKKTKENVSDANLYVKANRGQDGDYRWEHQLH